MRQRSFEIIRVPELEGSSFLFNNIRVSYVASCPETGISFYCSTRVGNFGVRVYPNGRKVQVNATTVNKGYGYVHGKADYLQFKHAFGWGKNIYVSHAVWMAAGRKIKPGFTIDHINGCTTNNSLKNLRCLDEKTNLRDGGFLTKLRNKNIDPTCIHRSFLLRYYSRMAAIKTVISKWRYEHLTREELIKILFSSNAELQNYFQLLYNVHISFQS